MCSRRSMLASLWPGDEALPRSVEVDGFLELARDRLAPEGDRSVVPTNLVDRPRAREQTEDRSGRQLSNTTTPVFAHDEELAELVGIAGPNEDAAGDLVVDRDEEWMSVLLPEPVVSEVPIAVLTMR